MTRRNPPAKWVLPSVVDPPKRRCFVIEVPDEPLHIAAFRGAILDLASAYKWQDDVEHTARDVALVWRDVYDRISNCPVPQPFGGVDDGGDILIRQSPANPCILESSVDGINWCAFADFSLCVSPQQPGDGAEQPPSGGGQACYKAVLPGNNIWLLPTLVSTGDVIEVSGAVGATSFDGGLDWTCPDGSVFLGGVCLGISTSTNPSNPIPSLPTNRLIMSIGGAYYDAMGGPVTVGSGVSNAVVTMFCNDVDRSDNAGSYNFDVCVINNALGTFTHNFNFALTDGGFSVVSVGVWTPSTGWQGQLNSQTTPGRQVEIDRAFSARTLTNLSMTFARGSSADGIVRLRAKNGGTTVFEYSQIPGPQSGSGLSVSASGSGTCDNVYIDINSHPNTLPVDLLTLTVTGLGSDPF